MNSRGLTAIVAVEAQFIRSHLDLTAPVVERLKLAMRLARDPDTGMGWAENDEDRFRFAVAAVLFDAAPDEVQEIRGQLDEMRQLAALVSALQSGVAVDIEAMAERVRDRPPRPFSLRALWDETGREAKR